MALRRSEAEKEAKRQEKEAAVDAKRLAAEKKERETQWAAFMGSPQGRARTAYERGDTVFQYSIDVHETKATVLAMTGAYTSSKQTNDPTEVLRAAVAAAVRERELR
jgi:hypothetical protein